MKKIVIKVLLITFFVFCFLGVTPEKKNTGTIPSYDLEKVIKTEGNIKSTYYVNDVGEVILPADKKYAYVVQTLNENCKVVLEQYYDVNYKPVVNYLDTFAIQNEYDENGDDYISRYLDIDGNLMNSNKNYCIIRRQFDNEHRIISEMYFDKELEPVANKDGYFGERYIYPESYLNDEGDIVIAKKPAYIYYLDSEGKISKCKDLYSVVYRLYDEAGYVTSEYYYDENLVPVVNENGVYITEKTYNEHGQNSSQIYYDAEHNLMLCKKGYSCVVKTYKVTNDLESETFYGVDGEKVVLSRGESGYRYDDTAVKKYIDADGNYIFLPDIYLRNQPYFVLFVTLFLFVLAVILNKRVSLLVLILYSLFIIYMTLINRELSETVMKLNPIQAVERLMTDYSSRVMFVDNICLFIPFGLYLYRLKPTNKIILIGFLVSFSIELIQFFFKLGACELEDLFTNTLGTAIGVALGSVFLI